MQVKAVLASSLATIATAQSTSSTSALASSGLSSSLGSASATAAAGQTIRVDVGKNGLNFSPSIVQASPGAKVEYHYYPKNNSVTQSSFQLPCQPLAGGKGINSGFNPTAAGEAPQVFTVTVNDTNPVWIYCAQTNGALCQSGMSMVINQPAGANSLAAYQNASKSTGTSGTLATIQVRKAEFWLYCVKRTNIYDSGRCLQHQEQQYKQQHDRIHEQPSIYVWHQLHDRIHEQPSIYA